MNFFTIDNDQKGRKIYNKPIEYTEIDDFWKFLFSKDICFKMLFL